jgi:hypothetical protein
LSLSAKTNAALGHDWTLLRERVLSRFTSFDEANVAEFADAKWIVPLLDYYPNYDDFMAGRKAVATIDGTPYFAPLLGGGDVFVYRKDILQQKGIPIPKTLNELIAGEQLGFDRREDVRKDKLDILGFVRFALRLLELQFFIFSHCPHPATADCASACPTSKCCSTVEQLLRGVPCRFR